MSKLTNEEVGQRIGVTHSMVSRMRSGNRRPSTKVLGRIAREFGIPDAVLVQAHSAGSEAFGELLRERVFAA